MNTLVNRETLTTTSNIVANKFGKRHGDLLRAIDNILPTVPSDFAERNIAFTNNFNKLANRNVKSYTLTKDGFMLIAMSLTGKEAMKWKVKFIGEFNLLTKENEILKDIVWECLSGVNYINQSIALKLAGIERIGLFMRYLKQDEGFLNTLIKTNRIRNMRCGATQQDTCWKFSQSGFEWLLNKRVSANKWVAEMHEAAQSKKLMTVQ